VLAVRQISSAEHLGFLQARPAASFLQCPSWAAVKQEWGAQNLGWYDDGGTLVRELYGHPDAAIARERIRAAFRQTTPVVALPTTTRRIA